MNDDTPKLLRAIAGTADAKAKCHDVIFNAAADELDRHREMREALEKCLPFIDDACDAHTVMSESAATDECRAAVASARSALSPKEGA